MPIREFGEDFTDGRSKEITHKAAGTLLKYDKSNGLLSFECKNRLELGTKIELISPEQIDKITLNEILNSKDQSVEVCHGGSGRYSIPFEYDPGEFAILRRPIYEAELANVF